MQSNNLWKSGRSRREEGCAEARDSTGQKQIEYRQTAKIGWQLGSVQLISDSRTLRNYGGSTERASGDTRRTSESFVDNSRLTFARETEQRTGEYVDNPQSKGMDPTSEHKAWSQQRAACSRYQQSRTMMIVERVMRYCLWMPSSVIQKNIEGPCRP